MRYCKQCVQPDTRPKVKFDSRGVCYACKYEEDKARIDWTDREQQLQEIAARAKEKAGKGHDCIIGVSGGKDSTFQALYAREKLGLNCLLVNLAPDGITPWGAHNIENLIQQGFDTMLLRPNPKVWKKTIRHAFYKHGNPVKPTEYPLFAVSYLMALRLGVPLIIQGENPGITLGVTEGLGDDDNALNANLGATLAGGCACDWEVEGLTMKDLVWYDYPDKEELVRAGIRGIYLNYYVREWGFYHNTEFSVKHGLAGRKDHDPETCGRLNPHGSIDSDMQIVNQMLKYYKFGFGFVTDEVCYAIRECRMTRDEAIEQVKRYDGKCGERYISDFCEYIGISVEEFWRVTDGFVNKELFSKDSKTGVWKPRFEVGVDLDEA